MPTQSLDQIAEKFSRDGFVNAGPIFDAAEVAELGEEMERFIDSTFRGQDNGAPLLPFYRDLSRLPDHQHYQLCGLWKVSNVFRRLIENPRLLEVAVRLSQAQQLLQVWSDTVQYKPPRCGAHFPWHQDAPYHDALDAPQRLVAAWVALDDADVDSGCMWMVPGSHRWGVREPFLWNHVDDSDLSKFKDLRPPEGSPEIAAEWRGAVACPVRAGEVHFHHTLTWHGSPTNLSERRRRGYTIHFMPEGMHVAKETWRVPLPVGAPLIYGGPEFPVVYGSPFRS